MLNRADFNLLRVVYPDAAIALLLALDRLRHRTPALERQGNSAVNAMVRKLQRQPGALPSVQPG